MNRFRLLLVLGAAAWAITGCVIDPATGERSLGQLISREGELAIGREEHPRILRQFGGAYADAQIAAYVGGISASLARVSELPELAFTFTVLNSPIVNAFALPGGYVYVTRGLLALAGSEAELASVLAHEIGHVTARHAAQRHQRAATVQVSAKPGELNQDPAAYVQGYSREQEMEADTLGIRYLARAGYDPQAMSSFLKKLDAHAKLEAGLMGLQADQTDQMSFTSTHFSGAIVVLVPACAAFFGADCEHGVVHSDCAGGTSWASASGNGTRPMPVRVWFHTRFLVIVTCTAPAGRMPLPWASSDTSMPGPSVMLLS